MAIDFHAEAERQRRAGQVRLRPASIAFRPVAVPSPLRLPIVASTAPFSARRAVDWPVLMHDLGLTAEMPDAEFPTYRGMWPVLGRRSVLAVVRNAYLTILAREPTLDECAMYLKGAARDHWNAAELHYLIAVNAQLASPRHVLSRRQWMAKAGASIMRRLRLPRLVPFRFRPDALALDALALDAMRLSAALARAEDTVQAS